MVTKCYMLLLTLILNILNRLVCRFPRLAPLRLEVLARVEGRRILGRLTGGEKVWSKLGDDHLVAHPDVVRLLPQVLRTLTVDSSPNKTTATTYDYGPGQIIGFSSCVPTTDQDVIRYARRKGRTSGATRFVLGREKRPCSTVRVVLYRNKEGLLTLTTAYIGDEAPPEPNSKAALSSQAQHDRCVSFWKTHALCWEEDQIDPEFGIHDECPEFWGNRPA